MSKLGKGIKRVLGSGKFRRLYSNFVYIKLCYGRFGTYMSIPKDMLDDFVRYGTLLAVVGFKRWYLVAIFGVIYAVFKIIFGHFDYRYKLPQLETSVHNKFNLELQKILRNTKGGKKNGNIKKYKSKVSIKQDK